MAINDQPLNRHPRSLTRSSVRRVWGAPTGTTHRVRCFYGSYEPRGDPGCAEDRIALGRTLGGHRAFRICCRGEMWDTSDVDLLIVLPHGNQPRRSHYTRWDDFVAPYCAKNVSPSIVMCPVDVREAGGVWFEAAMSGVILLDPAGRIARVFDMIGRAVAGGQLVRMESHGHPYWVRKEPVA